MTPGAEILHMTVFVSKLNKDVLNARSSISAACMTRVISIYV